MPSLERAMEGGGFGVPEQVRNLTDRQLRPGNVSLGRVATHLVEQLLIRQSG